MPQVLGVLDTAEQAEDGNLLDVNDLHVTFKKETGTIFKTESIVNAVAGVSFSITRSSVLSLVGESGSGKTTIAKCIMALLKPTSGSIFYDGKDVSKLNGRSLLEYRRKVQMIYQDPYESLNPRETVFTAIANPIRYLTKSKYSYPQLHERISKLLDEVALDSQYINRYPHQLSGGERQRVNIARALASDPELLVADEPITMLDAEQRLNTLRILKRLRDERKLSMLMVTHDLASAKLLSDKLCVIYRGKLVEVGDTKAVLKDPYHPYVQLILDSMPSLHTEKTVIAARTVENMTPVKQGCIYRPRCKFATQVCSETEPILLEKSDSHLAACHNPLNVAKPLSKKSDAFLD